MRVHITHAYTELTGPEMRLNRYLLIRTSLIPSAIHGKYEAFERLPKLHKGRHSSWNALKELKFYFTVWKEIPRDNIKSALNPLFVHTNIKTTRNNSYIADKPHWRSSSIVRYPIPSILFHSSPGEQPMCILIPFSFSLSLTPNTGRLSN